MIGRRAFVGAVIASVPLPFSDAFAQAQTFDSEFEKLKNDEFLLANTQAFGLIRDELTESRGTVRIRQRSDRKISQRASDLIIVFEVTSKETYTRKYQGVIRPGGESGITCGIGYDVGYVTEEYLREDWVGFISDTDIKALSIACGVTGNAAQALRRRLSQIQIPYDVAVNQFFDRVLPFYVAATLFALPRASELSDDSLGALVSLVYNRGASFKKPGPRHAEMRQIRQLVKDRNFAQVPDQISNMARLWTTPDVIGVARRRRLEALLFSEGLGS